MVFHSLFMVLEIWYYENHEKTVKKLCKDYVKTMKKTINCQKTTQKPNFCQKSTNFQLVRLFLEVKVIYDSLLLAGPKKCAEKMNFFGPMIDLARKSCKEQHHSKKTRF